MSGKPLGTILICSNVYPPRFIGGAELIAHYQAQALRRQGWRVIVFTGDLGDIGERHAMRLEPQDGIPVFRVRLIGEDYQPDFVSFHHAKVEEHFQSLLAEYKPDVVHMHNIMGLSLGIIRAAKKSGTITAITLHDFWGFCLKNTIIKDGLAVCHDHTLCRECLPSIADGDNRQIPIRLRNDYVRMRVSSADHLISPSLYLAQKYATMGFPLQRIRVVWNGIDSGRFGSLVKIAPVDEAVRFTFIGHLGHHKGVSTLFEAIRRLDRPASKFFVNLVGVGELMEPMEKFAAEHGLAANVRFWGRVPNEQIHEVFAATDVQLLPSIWPENQPVSITEAMASETAVIASTLGGTAELVEEGESGFLTIPGDAEDLAARMRAFIDDPELSRRFGARGRARMLPFSFDRQVEKISRLYRTPVRAATQPETLVVFSGRRFIPALVEILNHAPETVGARPLRFVMDEWIDKDELRQAAVVVLLDDSLNARIADMAKDTGKPVLFSAMAPHLRPALGPVARPWLGPNSLWTEICAILGIPSTPVAR